MAKEDNKPVEKKKTSWFGGLLGGAESKIKSRKQQLDEASGDVPTSSDEDAANGKGRPSQSRKWSE